MTLIANFATHPRMGRKKKWHERMGLKLAQGTLARIDAVLREGEDRSELVRELLEREIKRREKATGGRAGKGR